MRKWLLMFTVVLSLGLVLSQAWGYDPYVNNIPNGTVFSCSNCHPSATVYKPLRSFGSDYKSNGKVWSLTLASLDSDGDGYTNGVELQDPNGTWVKGQPDPGNQTLVSNPGDPNSTPPAGCNTWSDVIAKYNEYVDGNATWADVINCYNEYAAP